MYKYANVNTFANTHTTQTTTKTVEVKLIKIISTNSKLYKLIAISMDISCEIL